MEITSRLKKSEMHSYFKSKAQLCLLIVILFLVVGCRNNSPANAKESKLDKCDSKYFLVELEKRAKDYPYLSEHLNMGKGQYIYFYEGQGKKISSTMKNNLIEDLVVHLSDTTRIVTQCQQTEDEYLTIGDLAFYCIAKTELMPFFLATGGQNCTEPIISESITIPTNFYKYLHYDRKSILKSI